MITIVKNQENKVTFQVDQNLFDCNQVVELGFYSPSRDKLTFTGLLDSLGGGFFRFTLSQANSLLFEDDTYSYYVTQNEVTLNHGRVRLRIAA